MTDLSLSLRSITRRILLSYLAVAALLVLFEWLAADAKVASVSRLTSLRRTDGLASWVIGSLAVIVALAAWRVWAVAKRRRTGWFFIAIFFSLVALDRGTRLTVLLTVIEHDRFGLLSEAAWYVPWTAASTLAFLFLWLASPVSRTFQLPAAAMFAAAASLQAIIGGPQAGSLSVLCTGAGLSLLLVVFLRELAIQDEPLTWSKQPEQSNQTLRRISIAALTTFIALCLFDFWLESRQGVNPVLRRYFNPASEASLSSWLATTQSLLLALTAWLAWALARHRGSSRARGWLVLATCFTYLSLDDGAMVHERVATMINVTQSWIENFPSYTWQFVYLPLLAMLGAFVVLFLWTTLATRFQRGLLLGGLCCLVFAVGLDYIEGLQRAEESMAFRHGSKVIEETAELIGVHLIWIAVLSRAVLGLSSLRVHIDKSRV